MTENVNHSRTEESVVEAVAGREVETSTAQAWNQQGMEPFWKDGRSPDPARRCTARRSNGEPCRRIAIMGGTVCPTHGGSTAHVKRKARVRLDMAADKLTKGLLGLAQDESIPPQVRLAAIRDALGRIGISEKTTLEVELTQDKPFEAILTEVLTGGSRAESRVARGVADEETPDWLAEELEDAQVLEAEVVEELAPALPAPQPPAQAPREASPATGLMTMEDALDQLSRTSPPPVPLARRRGRR